MKITKVYYLIIMKNYQIFFAYRCLLFYGSDYFAIIFLLILFDYSGGYLYAGNKYTKKDNDEIEEGSIIRMEVDLRSEDELKRKLFFFVDDK